MRRALLLLTLLGCSGPLRLTAPAATFIPSAKEVEVFDILEIAVRLDPPPAGNPFLDAQLRGRFQRAGEPAQDVDGFWDGDVFRVRYMPAKFGEHLYSLRLRAHDRVFEHKGAFQARESKRKGPVRVDKVYPWHFVREGGERFLWNSATSFGLLGLNDAAMKEAVDRFARLKIDRLRVALTMRHGPSLTFGPWVAERPLDVENPGYDVRRFDLEFWGKAERLLRHAREKDVAVSLIFYVDGARRGTDPFGPSKMGGEEEKLYFRYAVARLAAFSNVMWDLASEYRLFRDDLWAETMGALVKEADPYDRLLSVGGHADFRFHASAWADYAAYQSLDEQGGHGFMLQARRAQAASGRVMPQVNEDYGAEGPGRRRIAWGIALAGAHATSGGRGDALVEQARLFDFLKAVEAWRLEPRDELAGNEAYVLADIGRRYVLYQPEGRPASLRLEPGRWRARRYDPRTGAWSDPVGVDGPRWTSPEASADFAWLLER